MSFHLIPLEVGDDDGVRDRFMHALEDVAEGETAFFGQHPPTSSELAHTLFVDLVREARTRKINIVTTLGLSGELLEDLPGRDPMERYHAVAIFTRHGAVHTPQAKIAPQAYEELDLEDGVAAYGRANRVSLDLDGGIVQARFVCADDLGVLLRHAPADLAVDLLVVVGCVPRGAEVTVERVVQRALDHGVARTALWVNDFTAQRPGSEATALRREAVLDAKKLRVRRTWSQPRALRAAFWVYDDDDVPSYDTLAEDARRKKRIPVAHDRWAHDVELGRYPVTIVF